MNTQSKKKNHSHNFGQGQADGMLLLHERQALYVSCNLMIVFRLISLTLFLSYFVSCNRRPEKEVKKIIKADSLHKIESSTYKQDSISDIEYAHRDSIQQDSALTEAINLAARIDNQYFDTSYRTNLITDYEMNVNIKIGKIFSKTIRHIIVRRQSPATVSFNIFIREGVSFKQILSSNLDPLTYVSDTAFDVDGNRIIDFIINGYGSTGCCLKGFSEVFLLKPQ